jgi:hypothetical protein
MKCLVNGREVPAAALARQELNFSQPWPPPATPVPYQISVELGEFVRRFGDLYEQCAREEKADIPYHQIGEVPVLDRWQELGYPPLDNLLVQEPVVLEGLIKWFGQEALDQILPAPGEESPTFLINTVDQVRVGDGHVRIEGKAYLHSVPAHVS